MTRRSTALGVLLLAALAVAILALNGALRTSRGATVGVASVERELAAAVGLKLVTAGYHYPIQVSCAPPPPGGPPEPNAVHLVCQVTAFDKLKPKKSPMWVEDVTCNLLVPAGTPRCGSSGGDALQ
jgi:hypothetical protein